MQTAICFRHIPRQFAAVASLAAALAALADAPAVAKSSPEAPTIAAIEVGIKGCFKVGYWTPIRIEAEGLEGLESPRIEVTVPDSDGVPTTATAPLHAATSSGNATQSAVVYTKVGRIGSAIEVSLFDGDKRLDERTISSRAASKESPPAVALPATAELLVSFGHAPIGLASAFPDREADAGQLARRVVELNQVAALPTEWFGYEAVDVLLISAGNGKLCRELTADSVRFSALARWVELGGRLVVFCGGDSAQELLGEGGPLNRFAPGKWAELVPLRKTGPLEHFAGAAAPISIPPGGILRVPRFVEISGNIEAYDGQRASDVPLVVRSPLGLGEVAFVGVDISQPPLADWSGRNSFLQALLRPYLANIASTGASQRLVTRGYNDLSGALRQQLGRSFPSVVPIGFGVVAGLAIVYMVFLGPLDYLFVNRWVRRPWVAWVSFPVIVAAFCAGAMLLAQWRQGAARPLANRMELVDIDTLTGRARGTFWTTLYSPTATQLDLSIGVSPLDPESGRGREVLLSWWGLPGVGIGGMQASGIDLGIVRSGYRYGREKKSLENVPVLASATKSLMARWSAPVSSMLEADLTDQDGLAVGFITNQTGSPLRNVRLLYESWAYRLGSLKAGQRIEVGEQLSPRRVKTVVTHDVLGEEGLAEGRVFAAEQASPAEILSLMMFYDAAGGFGFAHLPNRYQLYCDLSRSLELGRAILVADVDKPATQLIDDATGNAIGDNQGESTVIYRFVLPVKRRTAP